MKRLALLLLALLLLGCGASKPAKGDPAKKITWAEYQKLDAEQKDDPYVVDNLDDDAKRKLVEQRRKKR